MASDSLEQLALHTIGGGWGSETGDTKNTIRVSVIRGTDIPRLRVGDFTSIPVRYESGAKVKNRLLKSGDIVIEVSGGSAVSGQHTGRALVVTQKIIDALGGNVIPASFCRLLRLDAARVNPSFIVYQIDALHLTGEISEYENQSTGIANFQFSRFIQETFPRINDLRLQTTIAHILGSLDDKIALNRKQNETLEEMASTLFKAWFVDFEPVRAKMEGRRQCGQSLPDLPANLYDLFPERLDESELGEVPEGWDVSTLGAVCTYLSRGISPKYIDLGGVLVLNQKCIRDFSIDFSRARRHDVTQKKIDGRALELGDVLVNSTGVGTLGRVAQVRRLAETTIVDSHVTVVRSGVRISPMYLGGFMSMKQPEIEAMGEGSTGQTELSRTKLGELKILLPKDGVLDHFSKHSRTFSESIAENHEGSETLAQLRDTLLPKLISGKLRIPDAERIVREVS